VRIFLVVALVLAILLGAAALVYAAPSPDNPPDTGRLDARLSGVASGIAQRAVYARCSSKVVLPAGELGFVRLYGGRPGNEAVLAPWICDVLDRFAAAPVLPSLACVDAPVRCGPGAFRLAAAAATLAHESWHLRGVRDESTTECYGIQTTAFALERLGAPAAYAEDVARYSETRILREPRYAPTEACRNGGPLDLRPASSVWP
jgi:hypothetical protein